MVTHNAFLYILHSGCKSPFDGTFGMRLRGHLLHAGCLYTSLNFFFSSKTHEFDMTHGVLVVALA
jgi:hypothetical protein